MLYRTYTQGRKEVAGQKAQGAPWKDCVTRFMPQGFI